MAAQDNPVSHIFRSLKVVDPHSPFHNKTVDLLINAGKIERVADGSARSLMADNAIENDFPGYSVSPGIFDMQVSSGEPGYEEKESVISLNDAALAGGITEVLLMPGLSPVTENRGQVEYLEKLYNGTSITAHIAGALSSGMEGKELSGFIDMRSGGAIAFTDDKSPVNNPVLLHLALQYSKASGGLVMVHCEDSKMSLGGKVNEGEISVKLGIKGAPSISEELGVMRNIALAEYHDAKIHLSGISTKSSVHLIRKAKAKGLKISCSVYAHQLYFNETELEGFDSFFKVWPPLRTDADQEALIEGIADGTIDVICSDHRPENQEQKQVEFEYAAFGMSGLETLFGATLKACKGKVETEKLIEKLCYAPRNLFGLNTPTIREGNSASFFIYNAEEEFTFTDDMIRSKSANNPFPGRKLQGRVAGTFTAEKWFELATAKV